MKVNKLNYKQLKWLWNNTKPFNWKWSKEEPILKLSNETKDNN